MNISGTETETTMNTEMNLYICTVLYMIRYKYNMVFVCLTADLKQVYGSEGWGVPSGAFIHVWHPKSVCISNVEAETNGQPAANPSSCIRDRERWWWWVCSSSSSAFLLRFTSEGQLFLHPRSDLLVAFGGSPHLQSSFPREAVGLCKHHTCALLLLFYSNIQNTAQNPSAHSQTLKKHVRGLRQPTLGHNHILNKHILRNDKFQLNSHTCGFSIGVCEISKDSIERCGEWRNPALDLVNVELLTYTFAEFSFSFLPQRCETK